MATIYASLMIVSGGLKFVLLAALIYVPSTILFYMAMREQKLRTFTSPELLVFGAFVIGAAVGGYSLASGAITI